MLMGPAHELMLMGSAHEHMLMFRADEHMLMGRAHEHVLMGRALERSGGRSDGRAVDRVKSKTVPWSDLWARKTMRTK